MNFIVPRVLWPVIFDRLEEILLTSKEKKSMHIVAYVLLVWCTCVYLIEYVAQKMWQL